MDFSKCTDDKSELDVYLESLVDNHLDAVAARLYQGQRNSEKYASENAYRMNLKCDVSLEPKGMQVKAKFSPQSSAKTGSQLEELIDWGLQDADTKIMLLPLSQFAYVVVDGNQMACSFKEVQALAGNSNDVYKKMIKELREVLLQPLPDTD